MFVPNLPVTESEFFDREGDLARLEGAIDRVRRRAPQWLCIVGNRRVGKTSLLLEAARRARERPRRAGEKPVSVVVVDVMESAPVSAEIFRTLALEALDTLAANEIGRSMRALAAKPAAFAAAVTETSVYRALDTTWKETLLGLPQLDTASPDFARTCLELPEVMARASSAGLLVAIDEFQELGAVTITGAQPMALMRSVWQRHRHVGYVVSGSSRSMLMELATSRASPFFQHFTVMSVAQFSKEHAVKLLTEASADAQPISTELAERVFLAVGGHPFYLQVIGNALAQRKRGDDARAFRQVLQEELFSRTGALSLYFEREFQRLVGRATTLSATLDQLTKGPRRMADVARGIGSATGPTLNYLARLGDAAVKRDDGLWELSDPVFGLWLQWRRPGGSVVPMSVVGDEAELSVAKELSMMGFNTVYQSRGSRGAFDLLAMRGGENLALQVKRKPLPLRFKAAEWSRMQADGKALGWPWVVASVAPADGAVVFLDPKKAKRGTLGEAAVIENLLAWLDAR